MSEKLRNLFIKRHVERQDQEKVRAVANQDIQEVLQELRGEEYPVSELRMKPVNIMDYVIGIETDDYREAESLLHSLRGEKYDSFTVGEETRTPIEQNVNPQRVYGTVRMQTENGQGHIQVHDSTVFDSHLLYLIEATGFNGVYTEPTPRKIL